MGRVEQPVLLQRDGPGSQGWQSSTCCRCCRILQEQRGKTRSLAKKLPSFIFLCFLGCLSLNKVPNITNLKCCYISSFPICKEALLPRLSEVPVISVPGVFSVTLQSCEDFQKPYQGVSTQLFSLTEASS